VQGLVAVIGHKGVGVDRQSSTSYVETLSCFLDNNQNISKTAAALYVHRSTLIERLKRIKRDLGLDLDDSSTALRLRMLLEAMRIPKRTSGQ
jgi:DNA-binding PucR family transcriptional regulator